MISQTGSDSSRISSTVSPVRIHFISFLFICISIVANFYDLCHQVLLPVPLPEELRFISDFRVWEDGTIFWEHVQFSSEGPNAEMVARSYIPPGMLFPLGAVFMPAAAPVPTDGAGCPAGYIIDVLLPGSSLSVRALLDTNPYLTHQLGFGEHHNVCTNAHCILGPFVRRSCVDYPANVELVHLSEAQYRYGGSRFALNSAGYYLRALTALLPGEAVRLAGDLRDLVSPQGAVMGAPVSTSGAPASLADGLAAFRSGLVVFGRGRVDAVPSGTDAIGADSSAPVDITDPIIAPIVGTESSALGDGVDFDTSGLPASLCTSPTRGLATWPPVSVVESSTCAESAPGSTVGETSLVGGCRQTPSPVYYGPGTAGDPLTCSAHLISRADTLCDAVEECSSCPVEGGSGADGSSGALAPDGHVRSRPGRVWGRDAWVPAPAGFIRSRRATNWPAIWNSTWDAIGVGEPDEAQVILLKKCIKREGDLRTRSVKPDAEQNEPNGAPHSSAPLTRMRTSSVALGGLDECDSAGKHHRVEGKPRTSEHSSSAALPVRTSRARSHSSESLLIAALCLSPWAPIPEMRRRCDVSAERLCAASRDLNLASIRSEEAVSEADTAYRVALLRACQEHASATRAARQVYMGAIADFNHAQFDASCSHDALLAAMAAADQAAEEAAEDEDSSAAGASVDEEDV